MFGAAAADLTDGQWLYIYAMRLAENDDGSIKPRTEKILIEDDDE